MAHAARSLRQAVEPYAGSRGERANLLRERAWHHPRNSTCTRRAQSFGCALHAERLPYRELQLSGSPAHGSHARTPRVAHPALLIPPSPQDQEIPIEHSREIPEVVLSRLVSA